jgi:quinone-modifying oxidoreductase subunit QmoC
MNNRDLIKPDSNFTKEVIGLGGESLKKCFQCSTCSVVCTLSPDDKPFPRKEMLWAQWGLKDRLLGDPDIWRCHQCNDCTVHCPRDAGPGNVLAALRNYSFGHYANPAFLGKAFRNPKYLPLLLLFPVVLFLILLGATGNLTIPEGEIVFEHFMPHIILDPVFLVLTGLIFVIVAMSLSRFWRDMKKSTGSPKSSITDIISGSAISNLIEFLQHKKFYECGSSRIRMLSHMAIFYGCMSFALVTASVFIGTYTVGLELPMAQYHPLKIIANLGAIAVITGCLLIIVRRLSAGKATGNSSYLDWNLVILILVVTSLGILTEVLRLADLATAAYVLYFIHLVLVFYGIAYFPYSKLAHLLYRSLAILYADSNNTGDKKPLSYKRKRVYDREIEI